MKPKGIDRVKSLISKNQIIVPSESSKGEGKGQEFEDYEDIQLKDISEAIIIGRFCGGIVVAKDQQKKELLLHLISLYNPKTGEQTNISPNKFLGYLKDYELKADLSIFTYINAFKNIQLGAFINTIVRKIDKREVAGKNILELGLSCPKPEHIKVGIIKDHTRIPASILKVFEKQRTLPMNFQILYSKEYDNPGLIDKILHEKNLRQNGSLHQISNICAIEQIQIQLDRIRYIQEKRWAIQHLQLGLDCLRNGRNQTALDCLKIAKRFDPDNPQIYIARGCTLANMNNGAQGLKQLKQALKIDPNNTKAREYYDKILNKMSTEDSLKKKQYGDDKKNYGYVHKK